MKEKKFEPIPIPWEQRLRELRVRVLPIIVFLCVGAAVIYLWRDTTSHPTLIGQVVGERSAISSPVDGTIINFYYEPFDEVNQGELLGQVFPRDSVFLQSQLNLIRAEIERIEQTREPVLAEQRVRLDLEDLKISQMETRISLAQARLQQQQAESEFERFENLRNRELISEQRFDSVQTKLELFNVQVREYQNMLEYYSDRIREIEDYTSYGDRADRNPVLAAIKVQEQQMEAILAEFGPTPFYAPISGVISSVQNAGGEFVSRGDSLLVIESREPTHIVGYVRQPFTQTPEVGMNVQVRTRKANRTFFDSQIEEVGGHVRLLRRNLQRPGAIFESGLPIKIAMADSIDLNLMPGELVDIVLSP
ncbi:MAG: HlyD family efflux transporter periplasmic adaptor subunit [Balneolaceae bacterium]|nr:HlyD family efflux transporter periplasmic adaptor subunit [Balneolaceae bacterium]MDR9408701.1 HlyD family efflux transporter periplasmic adaptor subunit [Balneolaceae bacterium]